MKKYGNYLAILSLFILFSPNVLGYERMDSFPEWTDRELEQAIETVGYFKVLKSDVGCSVRQSYEDSSMMEISYSSGSLNIYSPFYKGYDSDIEYWVDDGNRRYFSEETIESNESIPSISSEFLERMKNGESLYLKVNPTGEIPKLQVFRLEGLTEAIEVSETDRCSANYDNDSESLTVNLKREGRGLSVTGKTSLPSGFKMNVSIYAVPSGSIVGSGDIFINRGRYESEVIDFQSLPVSSSEYMVSFSSPLNEFQNTRVARSLDGGKNLPEDIRVKNLGSYRVDYMVRRRLK